jgi:hypothetical protein
VEEDGRIEAAKELVFYLMVSTLVRIEALTYWSGPVLGSWNELRIERQRAIKREISSLFDLVDDLTSISRTIRTRLRSYRKNMDVRRNLASLSRVRTLSGGQGIRGKGGEIWKGKIILDLGKKAHGLELLASISLPGLSWNLEQPPSQRDGQLFILPTNRVGKDGKFELDVGVSTPSSPSPSQTALVYLVPSFSRMEVEE